MDTDLFVSLDVEIAVLGTMIISRKAANYACGKVIPEDFYRDSHRVIFQTMAQMTKKKKPIDMVSLMEELKDTGNIGKVGGAVTIATIADKGFEPHVETYIQRLKEKSERRQLRTVLQKNLNSLDEPDCQTEEVFITAQKELYQVVDRKSERKYRMNFDVMMDYTQQLEKRKAEKKGISWGFRDMDSMIGKIMPGRVYYVGARPGVGKTALALSVISNVAKKGFPVYLASMEMSEEQIADREMSMTAHLDGHVLQHGYLQDGDWNKVAVASSILARMPLAVDDERQTTSNLRLKVRQFKADMLEKAKEYREQGMELAAKPIEQVNGLGLVVVDYFQLFKDPMGHMDKDQWTAQISGALIDLAKDLNVAVMCLSQLNRESEKRGDKRPQLADLRGGGAQEQDGWVVLLLHKQNDSGQVDVIVDKNRSGPTGIVRLTFLKEYTKFSQDERWQS